MVTTKHDAVIMKPTKTQIENPAEMHDTPIEYPTYRTTQDNGVPTKYIF